MRHYICRSCEDQEIALGICYCRCRVPPVGCLMDSHVGDLDETRPAANWLQVVKKDRVLAGELA